MHEPSYNEVPDASKQVLSRMRELMPENGKLFLTFMENSPAQAWIASENCTMFYMNKAYRRTFKVGDEILMKQPSIFPKEYLQTYIENNRKVLEQNAPLETHEDGYDSDGNYRVFKVCKFPLGVYMGVALVGGWMVDITELDHISTRHRYASQATADVIWEWDLRSKTLHMGEGYEKLMGYSNQVDLTTLESHVHPEDLEKVKGSIAHLLKTSFAEHWEMEYRYITKDGAIINVLNKAYVVREKTGQPLRLVGALQDVTELRRLQQELSNKQARHHRQMLSAVMKAQERERTELGKELHDNVNQILATAKLMMSVAVSLPEKTVDMFQQASRLIEDAINEIRNISHRLSSPEINLKFSDGVARLASILNSSGKIHVTLDLPEDSEITGETRLHLYRITQEQIHNIIKHAKATAVHIQLTMENDRWKFAIKDNGIGFDVSKKHTGTGLRNIKSRVELLSGTLHVSAAEGHGCILSIEVPCSL